MGFRRALAAARENRNGVLLITWAGATDHPSTKRMAKVGKVCSHINTKKTPTFEICNLVNHRLPQPRLGSKACPALDLLRQERLNIQAGFGILCGGLERVF
jgi:hypothetical protein